MIKPNKELFPDWELFVFDLEVYPNSFINHIKLEDGSYRSFEVREGVNDLKEMLDFMTGDRKIVIGFNSLSYDDMVIKYIRYKLERNVKIEALNIFNFSDALIGHQNPDWWFKENRKNFPDIPEEGIRRMSKKDANNKPSWFWELWRVETPWARSIDIFKIKMQDGSLKEREAKASWYRLQDLPYEPGTILKPDEIKEVFDYGKNDVEFTTELFNKEQAQLYNRLLLEEQYEGLDVLSQHDAGVSEQTILYLYQQSTGVTKKEINKIQKPTNFVNVVDILSTKFEITDPDFQNLYAKLQGVSAFAFTKIQKAYVKQQIKDKKIVDSKIGKIGHDENGIKINVADEISTEFTMGDVTLMFGAGGLHSVDDPIHLKSTDDILIIDIDVRSYYPEIMIKNKIKPERYGAEFLRIFKEIVDTRLRLKDEGKADEAGGLKIVANAGYGKFGSEFSTFYSPVGRLHVCIEGQIALIYLIQELQKKGIKIISANTDGICCQVKKSDLELFRAVYSKWEKLTDYEMEETHYDQFIRRDVNNYIAIKSDGKVKYKGAYSGARGIAPIVSRAARAYFISGESVEESIESSTEIRDFLFWFHAKRDWDMHHGEIKQQQTVRWYVKQGEGDTIFKSKLKEKGLSIITVPNSENSVLMNDIGDFPNDINRQYYIDKAYDLINGVIDG